MGKVKENKTDKPAKKIKADIIFTFIAVLAIAVYIFAEAYSALHVDVETITAVTSTVYDSVEAEAIIIRDEHTIKNNSDFLTVAAVENGEKVKLNGNIAMEFDGDTAAKQYAKLQELNSRLTYYRELAGKSAGVASDVETVDAEILNSINEYVRATDYSSVQKLPEYANVINDNLTRRQMIIGENVDFSEIINNLQSQIDAINPSQCSPKKLIKAEQSGIFSSYTDGLESEFDYSKVQDITVDTFKNYLKTAKSEDKSLEDNTFGKLITSYEWYFCALVNTEDIKTLKNGDSIEVAVKDSDEVVKCLVVSGADASPSAKETVLVLKCSRIDSEITSMRVENIEIRYKSYTGFKVPSSAIHIDENGEKCVYSLVANQAELRRGKILYSNKDFSVFAYEPEKNDSIRFYDRIITQGKDLHHGKVYN